MISRQLVGFCYFMGKSIKNPKIGDKAGRLTLINIEIKVGLNNRKRELFYCKCDCGTILDWIRPSDFGNKKSCGCLDKERLHHKAHTKIWGAWQKMKSRCNNKNNPKYPIYGAAGRFVCQGFMDSKHFFKIVGEPPTKKHSLDRKNNNGSYTCGVCEDCIKNKYALNVHWATPKEQSRNVNTNFIVKYNGTEMCLSAAAEMANIRYKSVHARIKRGWSVDDALNTPIKTKYTTKKNEKSTNQFLGRLY